MKKNIVIVALTILLMVFVVYSNIKANQAYQAVTVSQEAVEMQKEATTDMNLYQELARQAQDIAEANLAEAQRQHSRAEDLATQLKECQGN